ncbi:Krueppel homolog 1 isoform X1 [Drosophila nasuta]|uniref:Krueppel homolog 1 isoform X1 n=2 Tax=Drosophila nasuta TaxID=42062 RepID=UPI00295E86E9|nr:Krueppel homolog 1 isoform X1 [Drosophila nasuta]
MTEAQIGKKSWSAKQNGTKDTFTKSCKDLKDISKVKPSVKVSPKKTNRKDSSNNMVYYSANQLLIKTEQPNQSQYCIQTPLITTSSGIGSSLAPTNGNEHYELLQTPQQRQLQLQEHQQLTNYQLVLQQQQHESIINITSSSAGAPVSVAQPQIKSELPHAFEAATISKATTVAAAPRKPNTNKPQFKCEQCGMTFGSKSAHTSHTKSHAKNADMALSLKGSGALGTGATALPIELNDAGLPIGIPKSPTIKPMANVAAGADPYQCNVCQKTFAVPARLIRHYRTHTGERPFECEFCHKLFSVKENLQVHRRIHTKERPYKCDVCGRAFEHSGKLHRHMRIHTGERPHKCSVCDKTFIQSGQLVIHMRTHTGEKPYKCPEAGCGKGFTCSKQLKVHSRTHTGEKPYHCDICFRDFGYNHVLKLHRVQHYGAKCYKCTICDETFKNKKEMEAHIKGHANEIPDDEVEGSAAAASSSSTSSTSVISNSESSNNSPPGSPHAVKKSRQSRGIKVAAVVAAEPSPSPSRSPFSPSSISSTYSPLSSRASPQPQLVATSVTTEPEALSCDSGVSSAQHVHNYPDEELPTDLSMQQPPSQMMYYQQQPPAIGLPCLVDLQTPPQHSSVSGLTINPALLEAASIARLDHDNDLDDRKNASSNAHDHNEDENDVQTAAWQMMQLRRGHGVSPASTASPPSTQNSNQSTLQLNDLSANYDDAHEANVLIDHFKRGDLARHGLHKGYAPVPKYESALPNSDIVRRVEAAIGLRSSTESPERSSSPESDSLMMADRNVMTLPLRKRKHYMNEGEPTIGISRSSGESAATITSVVPSSSVTPDATNGAKVMRMSSVIQFAKAS